MPAFRKIPVEVLAVRWTGDMRLLDELSPHIGNIARDEASSDLLISTLEGTMRAHPGDWIVRGVAGELHPVRDDIFRKTYQAV